MNITLLLQGFPPIAGGLWNVTPMTGEESLYCDHFPSLKKNFRKHFN